MNLLPGFSTGNPIAFLSMEDLVKRVLETISRHLTLDYQPSSASSSGASFSHLQLPTSLLLELSSVLASKSPPIATHQILPRVLSCLRTWRVLPTEEKLSPTALRTLAIDLAGLAVLPAHTLPQRVSIIPLHDARPRTRLSELPLDALFRSGCSACRMPRCHSSCVTRQFLTDAENVPPTRAADAPQSKNSRRRASTVVSAPPCKPTAGRRNTTSTSATLSSLPQSAITVSRSARAPTVTISACNVFPAVLPHVPQNLTPRPWPLPDPSFVAVRKQLKQVSTSANSAASIHPRGALRRLA
ncbi:hypothetical protein B0H13DRAFT_1931545 [Mycena leptocephala]|nr:hypothetical protein B0H13DRAFT_1931545 [Mycena leptocephala]